MNKQLWLVFGLQFALTVLGSSLVFWFTSTHQAVSFFAGAMVSGLNLILLVFIWSRIFNKSKKSGLSIGLILFKYLLLGVIIYFLVVQDFFSAIWFGIGLATIMMTSLLYSGLIFVDDSEEKKEVRDNK